MTRKLINTAPIFGSKATATESGGAVGSSSAIGCVVFASRCVGVDGGRNFIAQSFAILGVGDVLHPIDNCSVEIFLNGDVGHRGGGRCAVPMFFAGWKPDGAAGTDFFNWAARALRPSASGGYDERLAKWMSVPRGARASDSRWRGR